MTYSWREHVMASIAIASGLLLLGTVHVHADGDPPVPPPPGVTVNGRGLSTQSLIAPGTRIGSSVVDWAVPGGYLLSPAPGVSVADFHPKQDAADPRLVDALQRSPVLPSPPPGSLSAGSTIGLAGMRGHAGRVVPSGYSNHDCGSNCLTENLQAQVADWYTPPSGHGSSANLWASFGGPVTVQSTPSTVVITWHGGNASSLWQGSGTPNSIGMRMHFGVDGAFVSIGVPPSIGGQQGSVAGGDVSFYSNSTSAIYYGWNSPQFNAQIVSGTNQSMVADINFGSYWWSGSTASDSCGGPCNSI